MQALDDVLGASPDRKPPARDIDGDITRARKLRVPNTHAFTNANADPEEGDNYDDQAARTRAVGAVDDERDGESPR